LSKRLLLLPCLLLVSVLALSACGGGGSSSGDESQIEEAIEKSAANDDPADCTKLQTQKFTEQTTQETGQDAVRNCEEEAEEEAGAESASVADVEVDGSTATAEAALKGGSFDGQTLEVELVKDGEQWKLNEVVKFTKFDQAKLVEAFKRELEKASSELDPQLAACFVEAFEQASQSEIEEMLLSGSTKALEEVVEGCPSAA
jgi:hypothetical protein